MNNIRFNPLSLYDSLSIRPDFPEEGACYIACPLPDRNNDYLAKNRLDQPALLLSASSDSSVLIPPPVCLEHLEVRHGMECRVHKPDGSFYRGVFSVIQCVDNDRLLWEYFLRAVTPLIYDLPAPLMYSDVTRLFNSLVELFSSLDLPSKKSIQGLWAELFIISKASDSAVLLKAWHNNPEDYFDFNAGVERIEVKSASGAIRVHHFSLLQLTPLPDVSALIASMFVRDASGGVSVFDLMDEIHNKVFYDGELSTKVDRVVGSCLGSGWRKAIEMKFDREIAAESLRFYDISSIPAISLPLPSEVSGVHFQSNLSHISPTDLSILSKPGSLFQGLC